MTVQHHIKRVLILCGVILLSACSALPDTLKTPQELNGEAGSVITDYAQWVKQPDSRSPIRLGGVIAAISNASGRARLELVNLPIQANGKPDIRHEPHGRFVVYIDAFLDPVTYAPGRLLSVVGNGTGREVISVDKTELEVPAMLASGWHLWRVSQSVIDPYPHSYLFGCRGLPCHGDSSTVFHVIYQVQ